MSTEGDLMDTSDDHPNPLVDPLIPSPSASPIPDLTQAGRPKRSYRIPARYQDIQPEGPVPASRTFPSVPPGSYALPHVILHVCDIMRTAPNQFGLFREYPHRPSYDPDSAVSIDELSNYPPPPVSSTTPTSNPCPVQPPPWPFSNMSTYLLMEWMITGNNQKSGGEVDRLVNKVLLNDEFQAEDLVGFNARHANKVLDDSEKVGAGNPYTGNGWREAHIDIDIPLSGKSATGLSQSFSVPGLHYRSLLSVMKSALADVTALRFHFSPFKHIWNSPAGKEEQCFDEVYTSDAWINAHNDLQKQPNEPNCKFEKVILGLMFWSDSTHLANFGTAKVWPLYLYFGNLSKYFRGKPSSGASHHVAYIPSVWFTSLCTLDISDMKLQIPDEIHDVIPSNSQKANVLTHCRRELMHGVWNKLLDDDFVNAYRHGFAMECLDGVWRRFYPRIFTYSADYPEKCVQYNTHFCTLN